MLDGERLGFQHCVARPNALYYQEKIGVYYWMEKLNMTYALFLRYGSGMLQRS